MDDNTTISKESAFYGNFAILSLLLIVTLPVSLSVVHWLYDLVIGFI